VLKTAIVNLKLDWNPIYWMSDYEDALTKAIKQEVNILFFNSVFFFSYVFSPVYELDMQYFDFSEYYSGHRMCSKQMQ